MSPAHRLDRDDIHARHYAGQSTRGIAADLGCSPNAVRRHLAPIKPPVKPPGKREPLWLIHADPAPWMADAACASGVDPDIFFPSDAKKIEPAQAVCRSCPVAAECLEYALRHRVDDGVWGGLDNLERRRLLRIARDEKP